MKKGVPQHVQMTTNVLHEKNVLGGKRKAQTLKERTLVLQSEYGSIYIYTYKALFF